MAYKVLGQTSATAASSSTTLNLVKDPIFNGITRAASPLSTSASNWTEIAGTQWYAQCTDTYWASIQFGDSTTSTLPTSGIPAQYRYGTKALSLGSINTSGSYGYTHLAYGLSIANGVDGDTTGTTRFGGGARAIPVTGNTLYYFGFEAIGNQLNESDSRIAIHWFDSNGNNAGQTYYTFTGTSNSNWYRVKSSATSPSNAAYAGINIRTRIYNNNRLCIVYDGIWFGTESSLNTTFPDPIGGTNLLLTSPFTSRYGSTFSGTENNSTTVASFAGAAVDLYTVPAGKEAVISTVTATNASDSSQKYRIAVLPNGQTLSAKNWVVFDGTLPAFTTDTVTIGMTLAAGDKIQVASDVTSTQFSAFGSEN